MTAPASKVVRGPLLFAFAVLLASPFGAANLVAQEATSPASAGSAGGPLPASAERTVAFSWEGPSGIHDCMTPEALRAAVEADVGQGRFHDPPTDVTLRVRVERTPSGFRAALVIEGADGRTWGKRELSVDGPSCEPLSEPLTLAATLLVDKDMLEPPPKEEPKPEPPPPSEPPRLVIVNPPAPPGSAPTPWMFGADAALVGGTGFLPGFGLGGELGVEATPPGWPAFRLRGAAFVPHDEAVDGSPGASIRFSLAYAGLSLCPELITDRRVSASLCAGADIGAMRAESRGVEHARKTTRFVGQAVLGGRVTVRLSSPWFLRLNAALLPPLSTDEYVVQRPDGSEQLVFQRSPFSWAIGIGAGVEFGRPK